MTNTLNKLKQLLTELDNLSHLFKPQIKLTHLSEKSYYYPQQVINKYFSGVVYLREDAKYWLTDQQNMKEIIRKDWIPYLTYHLHYLVDKFDCDDFSRFFKDMLIFKYKLNQAARVFSYESQHSFNLIIFPDDTVRIFEPQTAQWWEPHELPFQYQPYYIINNQIVII